MTDWTDAMLDRLRVLHRNKKLSFSKIAAQLNAEFGTALTKNACVGMGRRLGLEARPKVFPPGPQPRYLREPPAETIAPMPAQLRWTVEPPQLDIGPNRITIWELRDGVCHYPFGSKPPYGYCGNTAKRKSPYCPHHETVMYPRGTR
jgi:hypothetical protein